MSVDPVALWKFLPIGYALTIALETPILLIGLSRRHSIKRRLIAGIWLTACTYPIVILVLPLVIEPAFGRWAYVTTAEIFAPLAECLLFWMAFGEREPGSNADSVSLSDTPPVRPLNHTGETLRDLIAIVVANVFSWLLGSWLVSSMEI
jgi:hypothetical protein